MDTKSYAPTSTGPFSSTPTGRRGGGPLTLVLIVILGLGTIVFGVLTVTFSSNATTATNTAAAKALAAATTARADQKKLDDASYTIANESPFRAYTAPAQYGSFVINFPKTWSSSVDEESSGTQVDLILNPDFIYKTNGIAAPIAARIRFIEQTQDQFMTQYASLIKKGTLKQKDLTVSGQPAFDLTGQFSDHTTTREIVVPVRDKVLTFTNENAQFATEFGDIVAQAKIIP
jgi:hypothetical protein